MRSWWRRTAARKQTDPEYELLDTGVFDEDRYFDVFVEYAKADVGRHPDPDHACAIAGRKRPQLRSAADALVPQHLVVGSRRRAGPVLSQIGDRRRSCVIELEARPLRQALARTAKARRELLFTENETNCERLFERAEPHPLRQRRHQRLPRPRQTDAVNPERIGHQGRGPLPLTARAGSDAQTVRLRLTDGRLSQRMPTAFGADFDKILRIRGEYEADEFYAAVIPQDLSDDAQQRHAAGASPACSGPSSSTTTT